MVFQLSSAFKPSKAFVAILITGFFILEGNMVLIANRNLSILLREKAVITNMKNIKRKGVTVIPINMLGCIFRVSEKYDKALSNGRNNEEQAIRISKVKESKILSTSIVLSPVEGFTFS